MSTCFWCHSGHEEVAITNYDPCAACDKMWGEGVAVFEVRDAAYLPNQPPLPGLAIETPWFPSSRVIVLKESAVRRIFNDDVAEKLIENGRGTLTEEDFERLARAVVKAVAS